MQRYTQSIYRDGHAENLWVSGSQVTYSLPSNPDGFVIVFVVTVWLPCESSRLYFLTSLGSPGFQALCSNVMGQISPSDDFLGKN